MNHITHVGSSVDIKVFYRKSAIFAVSINTDKNCILTHNFYFLTTFESLKVVLINVVAILMMSIKLPTVALLKIKVFWNKDYDVTISVHDVTNKILARDSNYIVNVVMCPKFGNSGSSMAEVIITSVF